MLAKNSFFIRHKKLILIIGIAVLLIAVCLFYFFSRNKRHVTFAESRDIYTVAKGNISNSITGSGVIKSSSTKKVSSEVSADVLKVNVAVGDKVAKGDVLFELDTTNLDTQIRASQKNVTNSSKNVSTYNEDIKNLKIYATSSGYVSNLNLSLGDTVNKNSTVFQLTNDDFYYIDCEFYYNPNITISIGDKASIFIKDSLMEYEGEVAHVSSHKTLSDENVPTQVIQIKIPNPGHTLAGLSGIGTITEKSKSTKSVTYSTIKEADSISIKSLSSGTVQKINIKNGDFVNEGDLVIELANDDLYDSLSTAKSNLSDAYEDLNNTKSDIDFYTITSPIDGVITSLNIIEGDYVRSETELCTIVNNDNLEFDITVDELDILDVAVGQSVNIEIDALSQTQSTPIIGYVSEISLEGTTQNSVTTYPVTISLSGEDNIRIGFNCSAEIVTSNVEDVLIVPVDAIETVKGKYYVTLENGTRQEVTVGTYNEDYIEVKDGLAEGDKILLSEKVSASQKENQKEKGSFDFSNMGGGMPSINMGGGGNRGNAGNGDGQMPGRF